MERVRAPAHRGRGTRGGGLMGHKVNPVGLRLGINRTWDSRWFSDGQYRDLLLEDLKIREFLHKRLKQAGVSKVVIERPAKKARISIHTARPGVVIGKKGQEIEALRKELAKRTTGDVHLNIVEIRKPEIDAKLIAENIAQQLTRRVTFRRAMKRAVQSAMRLGAQGIKVACGGRPGGGETGAPGRSTPRKIGAARRAITRHLKRVGRVWIRVFPDVPVSKKPAEVRMGSGKGAPEFWAARVKPGRVLFELDGVPVQVAREALELAAAKLPIKTRFVARVGVE